MYLVWTMFNDAAYLTCKSQGSIFKPRKGCHVCQFIVIFHCGSFSLEHNFPVILVGKSNYKPIQMYKMKK